MAISEETRRIINQRIVELEDERRDVMAEAFTEGQIPTLSPQIVKYLDEIESKIMSLNESLRVVNNRIAKIHDIEFEKNIIERRSLFPLH